MPRESSLSDCKNFVACSDLHLGEDRSRLGEHGERRALSDKLAEMQDTHELEEFDALVLAGDVVDLSMATYREALDGLCEFLEAVGGYFKKVVYVPGNHDHHIWLMSNECCEIFDEVTPEVPTVPQGFIRRTGLWYEPSEQILSKLATGDLPMVVEYPNSVFLPPDNGSRAFVVHHGHLVEDLYRLLSDLYRQVFDLNVAGLEDVECINSGWIEFIWYSFGQSGRHGANGFVESLYDKVRKGQTGGLKENVRRLYEYRLKKIVDKGARGALENDILSFVRPKRLRKWAAGKIVNWIHKKTPGWIWSGIESYMSREEERDRVGGSNLRGNVLDKGLADRCGNYIMKELRLAYPSLRGRDVTFIFGHTHKRGVYPENEPVYYNCGSFMKNNPAYLVFVDHRGEIHTHPF